MSDKSNIPSRYGLRHRAALGITEKTDALVLVISEQTGKIVYFKNGSFYSIDSLEELNKSITQDLSN